MPERENNGRKTIEEVQRLRARVAKLERIALRKAGPKDADRELDRAWSEWETTFDAIGDSVILLDGEFNIVQANAATSSLLSKPLDEIVGQRCCKLVHGSNEPLENCPLIKAKTTKKREKAELYIAEKGIWALVSVDPILDEQGNLTGAVHIIRDITERKKAEQQLAQSEQKYKELFESASEAIIIMDLNGKITDANRIVEEYGLKREQLLGKGILDFVPLSHRARAAQDFEELCHGTPVKGEMEVIAPKGNLTVEYRDNPIVRGGQIVAVQAILMDITERKKAEEALQAERQRLHDVLEAIPIMVCLLTPDYHVAFANRAFREKFGESHGRRCYEYCFGKKEPCDFCETYRVLKTAKPHHWQATTSDGASVIDVYDFPFTDVDGLPMILEMDIDITEQKRAEQALRDYQAELKSLASELSLAEERERRRIAAGIHDDIAQKLALAKMELQLLARPPGKSKIPASLDSVCARIDEAIKYAH
jgi:PAS domain S-box-containing protein